MGHVSTTRRKILDRDPCFWSLPWIWLHALSPSQPAGASVYLLTPREEWFRGKEGWCTLFTSLARLASWEGEGGWSHSQLGLKQNKKGLIIFARFHELWRNVGKFCFHGNVHFRLTFCENGIYFFWKFSSNRRTFYTFAKIFAEITRLFSFCKNFFSKKITVVSENKYLYLRENCCFRGYLLKSHVKKNTFTKMVPCLLRNFAFCVINSKKSQHSANFRDNFCQDSQNFDIFGRCLFQSPVPTKGPWSWSSLQCTLYSILTYTCRASEQHSEPAVYTYVHTCEDLSEKRGKLKTFSLKVRVCFSVMDYFSFKIL